MIGYIVLRVILGIVTLLGILFLNFWLLNILQVNPLYSTMANLAYGNNSVVHGSSFSPYQFQDLLLEHFNLQAPLLTRFYNMAYNYLHFNLGTSFTYNQDVLTIILNKLPVSLSLGFFSTLLLYICSITLGYFKAKHHKSYGDKISNILLLCIYLIPIFLIALLLKTLFDYLLGINISGLVATDFSTYSLGGKILNYLEHISLPVLSIVGSMLVFNTLFHKSIFQQEMQKLYYRYALWQSGSTKVFWQHLLKNVLLISLADFPAIFLGVLFGNSLFVEIIFNLNGIGLMTYNAFLTKDYPVILGTIYIMACFSLITRLISDVLFTLLDPRAKLGLKI
ncbi:Inner membrane ABC transporter permease protein YejB [Candidatus Hepatincola sp. Pdp]